MLKRIFSRKSNPNIASRPNIVMILLDQFRNDARGAHEIFEELGKRGVIFSKTITYAPYTLASLHATFTGMYGRENGVDAYMKSDQYKAGKCYSLPQYLKDMGYYTRGYTFSDILFPKAGFDILQVIPEDDELDILGSHTKELDVCYGQERPFFCFLHYGNIHHEIVKEVIKKYDDFDKAYFGKTERNMTRYLEHAHKAGEHLASLIRAIDRHDPDGNTMIIVFTDHGGGVGEKPGEKSYGIFTYDYSICVWVYFVLPGVLPAGLECDVQVRTIDILPTVMELLNHRPQNRRRPIMGKSLCSIIRGEESGHREAFSETGGVEGPYPSPDKPNIKCLRDGEWKLIFNDTINKYELYNLKEDPMETLNLYNKNPQKADDLLEKMVRYF